MHVYTDMIENSSHVIHILVYYYTIGLGNT